MSNVFRKLLASACEVMKSPSVIRLLAVWLTIIAALALLELPTVPTGVWSSWRTALQLILVAAGVMVTLVIMRRELAAYRRKMEETEVQMKASQTYAEQAAARLQEMIALVETEADTPVSERALEWALQHSGARRGLLWLRGPEAPATLAVRGEWQSTEAVTSGLEASWPGLPEGTFSIADAGQDGMMPEAQAFWAVPIASEDRPFGCVVLDMAEPAEDLRSDLHFLADRLAHDIAIRATAGPSLPEPPPPAVPMVAGFLTPLSPPLLDLLVGAQCEEEEALDYLQQVAATAAQFHARGDAYGLRPDDVRVDRPGRKVYLSQHVDVLEHDRTFFEGFSAPELATTAPTFQSDVFGLGALTFALYHRRLPRVGAALSSLVENLPPVSTSLPGLDYLIRKSLMPSPEQRLATAADFYSLLRRIRERTLRVAEARDATITTDVGADFNVGVQKGRNRGLHNADNEDRLYWDRDEGAGWAVLAIADGVSHADLGSGYRAAREVINQVHHSWGQISQPGATPADVIERIFRSANRAIADDMQRLAREQRRPMPWQSGMSSAACVALIHGRDVTVGNFGDVRAYLAGDGYVARLTRDGTRASQAIADPSFDLRSLDSLSDSELVEYVGLFEQRSEGQITPVPIAPNIVQAQLLPGEALVLASDGAYRYACEPGGLFEDLLLKVLASASNAQVAAFRLMASANQRGGGDNISCIIYRTHNLS